MANDSGILNFLIHKASNKDISHQQLGKIINETMHDFGRNILVDYAKFYNQSGKKFILAFLKMNCVKYASVWAVIFAEKEGIIKEGLETYGANENINLYVDKLELTDRWKSVLKRLLYAIWVVTK